MMSLVGMTRTTRAPSYFISCYNVKAKTTFIYLQSIKLSSTYPNYKVLPLLVNAYFIKNYCHSPYRITNRTTCESSENNLQPFISYTKAITVSKILQNSTLIALHKIIIGFII
jgi:hypothetical protein